MRGKCHLPLLSSIAGRAPAAVGGCLSDGTIHMPLSGTVNHATDPSKVYQLQDPIDVGSYQEGQYH